MDTNLISALNDSMQIDLPENVSFELLKEKLSFHINHLIQTDFQKLVFVLYRVDISEAKLRLLLKENSGTDAGIIIAELMIERQAQKIKSRQQYSKRDDNMSDDEKW
jgi:uncharacterized membrane protein